MRIVEKKIWPDKFDEDQRLSLDFRLADFDLEQGDRIRFREWDPRREKYTGREYTKTVRQVIKCTSPTRYWSVKDMESHGMYLMEWE